MTIKKGDFVEIEYTGRLKEENITFDTTDQNIAKQNDIFNEKGAYGPVVICVGESHVVKGLDEAIVGKDIGEHDVNIVSEDGFGKKNAKLLRLMPISAFRRQKIEPMPGLQVNIDGMMGMVKTVTGGRVIVDFNHPLSGKDLFYHFNILRKVDDTEEKVEGLMGMIGLSNVQKRMEKKNLVLTLDVMIPPQMQDQMQVKIKSLIPEITAVTFEFPAPDKTQKTSKKKVSGAVETPEDLPSVDSSDSPKKEEAQTAEAKPEEVKPVESKPAEPIPEEKPAS